MTPGGDGAGSCAARSSSGAGRVHRHPRVRPDPAAPGRPGCRPRARRDCRGASDRRAAPPRVGVQRRRLQAVQRAQECAQLAGRREARLGAGAVRASSSPGSIAAPQNGHGSAAFARRIGSVGSPAALELRHRDGSRQQRRQRAAARRARGGCRAAPSPGAGSGTPASVAVRTPARPGTPCCPSPGRTARRTASASSGNSSDQPACERKADFTFRCPGRGGSRAAHPLDISRTQGRNRLFSRGPNVPMIIRVPICLSQSSSAPHPPKGGPCHCSAAPRPRRACPRRERGKPAPMGRRISRVPD